MPYDSRIKELTDRYTNLIGKATFQETMAIKSALDAYTQKRNDMLPSLILQVTSTTDIPIGLPGSKAPGHAQSAG